MCSSHEIEEGSHHLLALKWSEDLEMRYWVDVDTYRVTHVEGTLSMGSRQTLFATEFHDFQSVDGVLFSFLEKIYASGRHVADTRVERLILEPEDIGPFEPPPNPNVGRTDPSAVRS